MSELQIALLGIGVLVIVVVYVYGFWQQRQYRRKFGAAFQTEREDVLYQPPVAIAEKAEALLDEEVAALEVEEQQRATTDDEICNLLDSESDYIVSVTLDEPQTSHVLSPLWSRRFDFGKSVNTCGLNVHTGRWERLIPESHPSYREFKVGLQLADRSGAVSEVRLMEFQTVMREVGDAAHVDIQFPAIEQAVAKAKHLDHFCASVDQMIGLNILPGGDRLLFGSEIAQVAERRGFMLQADGTFHLLDDRGLTLFSLNTMEGSLFQYHTLNQMRVQGLTLLLDVPRVDRPAHCFDEMAALARELAIDLRAGLVDDHRVSLGDAALAQIREQVAVIESQMLAGKIVPGSAQALRLFS